MNMPEDMHVPGVKSWRVPRKNSVDELSTGNKRDDAEDYERVRRIKTYMKWCKAKQDTGHMFNILCFCRHSVFTLPKGAAIET